MKSFIVFALIVAAVAAAPQRSADADAQILRSDLSNIGVDSYQYVVETSNGIKQEEQGQLQNVGTDNEAIQVRGQFSYVGQDGVTYSVTYVADENGFQPQGAHIPQPA
ncbi:flexible cuticle protein 12-like isoform X2 [Cydia strobilella]|uniref:flexible cuticle protein 12-like isoform X1 n=1 Tax=Cydia strobilella TaxID=1100964 RepID=UPI003005B0CC